LIGDVIVDLGGTLDEALGESVVRRAFAPFLPEIVPSVTIHPLFGSYVREPRLSTRTDVMPGRVGAALVLAERISGRENRG